MRYAQYKGVLGLVDSVIEAIDYMKAHNSGELCALCAQSLHSVLNSVKDEDNSDELISMLNNAVDCFENDVYDSEDLIELIRSIKAKATKELKYRLRVLFVAELGSKWDSMESVYKAFCDRDDCDVDVVLEPIFREVQYKDGSKKKEVIYNDWLTPLGIKHTLYDQYNMAKILPDMTFFSQPYESCTISMFWPQNMARYTKLVYLPYYAVNRIEANDHVNFDIFFKSPTEKYSWRIVCQSKIMKEYYKKYASHKGENVIAFGLPKWDYPCSLTKENTPCPEKWTNKIKGKKVFLWNTHYTIGSTKLLENFEDFLNVFNSSDDMALIWRPHPMTQTVVKLYYPEKYNRYLKMISTVEESPNMIIDTNTSYGEAFVWSDAMITPFSSLALQYILMDKPILFQIAGNCSEKEFMERFGNNKECFDFTKTKCADSIDKVKKFIDECFENDNYCLNDLAEIKEQYYGQADGYVGKKLSEILVRDYLTENK